jgi:hypothetical protein
MLNLILNVVKNEGQIILMKIQTYYVNLVFYEA